MHQWTKWEPVESLDEMNYKVHHSIYNPGPRTKPMERIHWQFDQSDSSIEVRRKKLPSWLRFGFLKDFCNETTIHGFNHIVANGRHPLEKFGWAAATLLAILGAVQLCLEQWRRYVANPTVVSLEKDYRTWNNTFLALTACLQDKFLEQSAVDLIRKLWNVNETDAKFKYYMEFVEVVSNTTMKNMSLFGMYVDDKTLQNVDLLQIATEVAPPFKGIVAWFDRGINLSFVNIMTELGICYTLNSVVSIDQLVKLPTIQNPLPSKQPIACQYITHPCYIRLELYVVCTNYYAHSPYEIIDSTSERLTFVCPGQDVNTDWKVIETMASDDVKALAIDQRNCRFHTEAADKGDQVYSGGICRRDCKHKLALQYCGCKPYFYPQESGKTCNIEGMMCLEKYKEKLARMEGCNCLPQCVDATYEMTAFRESKWTGPFSSRSSVKIGILPPRSRYRRQILFCFEDLVVSFGGAAGLFLGCSFLSGVEIVYFFLARIVSAILGRFGPTRRLVKTPERPAENSRRRRVSPESVVDARRRQMNRFIVNIAEYE